ncbi:MAG: glycosyltransferase family 39 protein [Planctomycetota bacterium]
MSERRLLWLGVALAAWQCLTMPVFAQEAYYWCYAQRPDLSYYDHPPMVAWMMWLGTQVFGDNVVGIRLGTFLCGVGTTWIGLAWLRRVDASAWVRRGWVVCACAMPMLVATHFLATPDPPLVFWWAVTIYAMWRTRDAQGRGAIGWWLLAGFAAGCALLSKYIAAFLAVGGLGVLLLDPAMRRQLRRPGIYLGVLAAVVTFMPVVLWNVANDFESFRFQTEGRWQRADLGVGWLLDFLGSQLGLLHPVIALALPAACLWGLRRALAGDRPVTWLLAFGLPMPLFFLANSLFIQVKINWLVPCFLPLAALALVWWQATGRRELSPRTTRFVERLMIGTALALGIGAPLVRLLPQRSGSSWHEWDRVAERAEHWEEQLDAQDGVEGNVFFFASDYRDAAQLSLHLTRRHQLMEPGHQLEFVLAQNVFGKQALQFDHWEPACEHVGEDAIYVLPRPDGRPGELELLRQHFDSVELSERLQVGAFGIERGTVDIYTARCYRGPGVR